MSLLHIVDSTIGSSSLLCLLEKWIIMLEKDCNMQWREGCMYISGITLTLAFFSSSETVVRMSVNLANHCLMKIHRPLDSIK